MLAILFDSLTPKSIIYPPLPCSLLPRKVTSTNCILGAFWPFVKFGLTSGRHQQGIKE